MDEDEDAPRATTLLLFVSFLLLWPSAHVVTLYTQVKGPSGEHETAVNCSCEQKYMAASSHSSHVARRPQNLSHSTN